MMVLKNKKYILPLLTAILLLLVFITDVIKFGTKSAIGIPLFVKELLIIVSFGLLTPVIYKSKWIRDKNTINKIKMLFIGLITIYIAIFIFNALLGNSISQDDQNQFIRFISLKNLFVSTVLSILLTTLTIFVFLILRDLIYFKRSRSTQRNFRIVSYIMLVQLIYFVFQHQTGNSSADISGNDPFSTILLITLIMAIVINSFRTSWVHFLNKQQKITYFLWGLILLPGTYALISLSFLSTVYKYSVTLHFFIKQTALFLSIYWSMALINLLLKLPTAGLHDQKKKEIASLHNLSRTIIKEFDPDKLLVLITEQSSEVIEANAVWLEISDPSKNHSYLASSRNLTKKDEEIILIHSKETISDWILTNRLPLLINETKKDTRTQFFERLDKKFNSLVGVPLISYDNFIGVLYAVKPEEFGFDVDQLNMLQAFADQAAIALDNARLVKESILKERYEQELKIAHEAQMKLLPKKMPAMENLEIDAICITANEVGGDYYDFIKLDDHRIAIIIGDVSGKGPEAAFYMAELKGIIESLARSYSSPKAILTNANTILYNNLEQNMFVTLIYGILDIKTSTLLFCRAGHCPLLFYEHHKKVSNFIEPKGIGLGLEKGTQFEAILEEVQIKLEHNDILLFYTDGVFEIRNKSKEEFGENRLQHLVSELAELSAKDLRTRLLTQIKNFSSSVQQFDDLTMIIIKIK